MSRPNPLILLSILIVTFAVFAYAGLHHGVLLISTHEGDTYHLLSILLRMEQGAVPHFDFMTPLGILSFLPIDAFMERGYGVGQSFLFAQVLVSAVLFPAIFYVSYTRLSPKTGYVFGAFMLIQTLALVYGGIDPGFSISMHYNRWSWAIAALLILLTFAPSRMRSLPFLDGMLVGLGLSALVLLKVTFFVALVPGLAAILLLQKRWTMIAVTAVTGLAVAFATTVLLGFEFWARYIGDLLTVAGSDVRPHPGVPLSDLLTQAKTISITVVGFLIYLLISRAGHRDIATGLLFLIPGCFFITYQNFGNDPKWLVPLIALMIVLRPVPGERHVNGVDMHIGMTAVCTAAVLLYFPSAFTIAMSPIRHAAQDVSDYDPIIAKFPEHQDVLIRKDRAYTMTAQVELDVPGSVWYKYRAQAQRSEPLVVADIEFPECEGRAGSLAWLKEIAADLDRAGLPSGRQLFVTDILATFWFFADVEPLQNGAPWYYGSLSGIENADYVLIPKCGYVSKVRRLIVNELEAGGYDLTPVRDTETYALFSVGQP